VNGSEAYDAFAYAYDKALGDRFFAAVRRRLDDVLERYPTTKRSHLDLACGTGLTSEYFQQKGWRSVGLDASLSMLEMARARAPRLVAADLRAIPLKTRFARITCLYDSLNHLLEPSDLLAAFQAVRQVMDDDSLFLFDVNHPEIYPEIWGLPDPFVASGRDYHLEIETLFRRRDQMGHATVRGWAHVGGKQVRIHEEHRQRAYTRDQIKTVLSEAGLAALEITDFDPYGEGGAVAAPTVKLFFVCRPA
jgi:SAM-dependent methyltransferase